MTVSRGTPVSDDPFGGVAKQMIDALDDHPDVMGIVCLVDEKSGRSSLAACGYGDWEDIMIDLLRHARGLAREHGKDVQVILPELN